MQYISPYRHSSSPDSIIKYELHLTHTSSYMLNVVYIFTIYPCFIEIRPGASECTRTDCQDARTRHTSVSRVRADQPADFAGFLRSSFVISRSGSYYSRLHMPPTQHPYNCRSSVRCRRILPAEHTHPLRTQPCATSEKQRFCNR